MFFCPLVESVCCPSMVSTKPCYRPALPSNKLINLPIVTCATHLLYMVVIYYPLALAQTTLMIVPTLIIIDHILS